MPSGIPVLQVPEEDILAHGTADPLADVATCLRADTHRQAQAHLAGHLASYLELMPDKSAGQRIWTCQRHAWRARAMDGERQSATAGDWGHVYGELLTFDDPSTRLPAIDRLEGFHPGDSSLYRRVMVAAQVETAIMPVWLYSMKYRSN
ncbi:MAG: gamma-glutamylcyclotransferase [Deltaproteobacteria bacterium]|nr:gamma-glutamylcyclotransferase [Deltaproteobacteria bacterium]